MTTHDIARPTLRFTVQVAQPFGQQYFDAAGGQIDFFADVFGKRDEEFTVRRIQCQQWCAGLSFAGEKDIADLAEQCRSLS